MVYRIAIVGSAPTTKHLAPFEDKSWDIWALAFHLDSVPRANLLFEIHDPRTQQWSQTYTALLKGSAKSIGLVMAPGVAKKFRAIPYPTGRARALLKGMEALNGSIAMMLAMAILEKPKEIGLWGVDLADDEEYFEQRPIVSGWLMVAMSMGIKVTLPDACPILKEGTGYGTTRFQGVESWKHGYDSFERMLLKMQSDARHMSQNCNDMKKYQHVKGGMEVLDIVLHHYRNARRGQEVDKCVNLK